MCIVLGCSQAYGHGGGHDQKDVCVTCGERGHFDCSLRAPEVRKAAPLYALAVASLWPATDESGHREATNAARASLPSQKAGGR